jgi:hypothetical protein
MVLKAINQEFIQEHQACIDETEARALRWNWDQYVYHHASGRDV